MNNEILKIFSLTILITITSVFVLIGFYMSFELLKLIFSPKINYDITKHYHLLCESNRLLIIRIHIIPSTNIMHSLVNKNK